ncbi:MAG TPA: Holliday junction branch migration DNA helicase RuvB [Methanoregulaceae archaeon]|nr:Holliday junction branch migration DNA helicase RuvB [Methanoregulaceae archaeon]
MKERVTEGEEQSEDNGEETIRPANLREFIGQEALKETLSIAIAAARKRKKPIDHILFSGPPGLGKTTLAHIISHEMGTSIHSTSGPVLEKPGDLAAILTTLQNGDVLFIDEVHRLNTVVEEVLYPAMEDFSIDVMIGEGPGARSIRLDIEQFTLIGATTRIGLLGSPFRDRFGIIARLNLYSPEELVQVVARSAGIMQISITPDACREIAGRSRGTPRIANRLLRRVWDYALVRGDGNVTKEVASHALTLLGIDGLGLDNLDRRILRVISEDFRGGPVGLKTIAISVGEEPRTIEDVYEPYLIQIGFIKRTAQGRETTPAAGTHVHSDWW